MGSNWLSWISRVLECTHFSVLQGSKLCWTDMTLKVVTQFCNLCFLDSLTKAFTTMLWKLFSKMFILFAPNPSCLPFLIFDFLRSTPSRILCGDLSRRYIFKCFWVREKKHINYNVGKIMHRRCYCFKIPSLNSSDLSLQSHGSEYEETIADRPSHDGNIKAYLESNIHIEPAFICEIK